MDHILNKDIKYLTGVGPKRAALFNEECQIFTCKDLLYYFPYRYIDRTRVYQINEIDPELPYIQITGKIIRMEAIGQKRKKRLVASFTDGTGVIELVWFRGISWMEENLKSGVEYLVFGKPTLFNRKINIAHPDIEELEKAKNVRSALQPMYSTTEKMKRNNLNSRAIHKLLINLLQELGGKIPEKLPDYMVSQYKLMALNDALKIIHLPDDAEMLKKARFRLKFDELFLVQLMLLKNKILREDRFIGFVFKKVGNYFNTFYHKKLSFELTGAQKRVLKEIRRDLGSGRQMNRLLQGDVGSGKTLVALMSILIANDNGFQACLMAPTEILATQHHQTIQSFLQGMHVKIYLLTGSTPKSERNLIHQELTGGDANILIGTHALIEDEVQFGNLGLVIIDEQHRFGVAQRAKLWNKNEQPPHVLVMTATPIPRTLAMTIYGDLEVSLIDELPPGRKPIKTYHYFDTKRLAMFGFLRKQIEKGRQVYIVYPLIKESEKLDYKNLEDGIESISRAFPPPKYAISVVHGKMKPEEKEKSMSLFKNGVTHIMVATTVIEVGVDIPNAAIMVIESAERFGLSQLHQLRGRVGRGADQSYCILMTGHKLSNEARQRISTMVNSNDGFEIAESDLKLRGPGDMEGTQQSGIPFDFKIASLAQDGQLLQYARNIAQDIIRDDPGLTEAKHHKLNQLVSKSGNLKYDWGVIS